MGNDETAQETGPGEDRLETAEKKLSALAHRVRKEKKALTRGTKVTVAVGLLLLVLVGGYFNIVYHKLKGFLSPEEAAGYAHYELKSRLGPLGDSLGEVLKDAAPLLAEEAEEKVLAGIPQVREAVEGALTESLEDLVLALDERLTETIQRVAREHRKDAEERLPELADEVFVEGLVKEMRKEMLDGLDVLIEERTGESLDRKLEQCLALIADINAELKLLQEKEHLTQEERLEKQFIETFLFFLRSMPEEKITAPWEAAGQ